MKVNFNINGTNIGNEMFVNVGQEEFNLQHDIFLVNDFVCSLNPNGINPLTLGLDFILTTVNERILNDYAKTTYQKVKILNQSYLYTTLYFNYKAVADFVDSDDFNDFMLESEADNKYLKRMFNLADLESKASARYNLDVYDKSQVYNKAETYPINTINGLIETCLQIAHNLSDISNKALARQNLNVYDKSFLYTQTESNNRFLKILDNLSDLSDKALARFNLSVYSTAEIVNLLPQNFYAYNVLSVQCPSAGGNKTFTFSYPSGFNQYNTAIIGLFRSDLNTPIPNFNFSNIVITYNAGNFTVLINGLLNGSVYTLTILIARIS